MTAPPVPAADTGDVTDRICRTVVTAIVEQALRPGAKLSEEVIGAHFGVSRTIVRTALNRLQADALVEFKRNRGAFVAAPSVEESVAVFEARRVIELAVVARAAERITQADLAALRRLIAHEAEVHAGGSAVEKHRLSGNFHVRLAIAAGNPVMTGMLENLITRCALVQALYGQPQADRCGADDHTALVETLAAKDAPKASVIMARHLDAIEAELRLDTDDAADTRALDEILRRFADR
jgi:DNA-binding GntR family transcriptional regulator